MLQISELLTNDTFFKKIFLALTFRSFVCYKIFACIYYYRIEKKETTQNLLLIMAEIMALSFCLHLVIYKKRELSSNELLERIMITIFTKKIIVPRFFKLLNLVYTQNKD